MTIFFAQNPDSRFPLAAGRQITASDYFQVGLKREISKNIKLTTYNKLLEP